MDAPYVLTQFGSRKNAARTAYRTFVMEGMKQDRVPELTGGGLIRSKGGSRRQNVCALRVQIAKRGLEELGLSLAEIALHVGVSTSGIARAVKRLEEGAGESWEVHFPYVPIIANPVTRLSGARKKSRRLNPGPYLLWRMKT